MHASGVPPRLELVSQVFRQRGRSKGVPSLRLRPTQYPLGSLTQGLESTTS